MSWVPNAINHIQRQEHEILHQTVFGGYGTKPDIFWAVDPNDMPDALQSRVEESVKDDTSGINTCAIIRLETLPAYEDEELQASGNPVACFSVYTGTNGSDAEYERQINIYSDRKSATPPESPDPWADIEGSAVARRLRKMSVTMGWTEPPSPARRQSSAAAATMPPMRAPTVVARHMSLAMPAQDAHHGAETAARRFTRKLSLSLGGGGGGGGGGRGRRAMSLQPHDGDRHDAALAAALAALEGASPMTPTSPLKLPEIVTSSAWADERDHRGAARPGPPPRKTRRMTLRRSKRVSVYEEIPEAPPADPLEVVNIKIDDDDDDDGDKAGGPRLASPAPAVPEAGLEPGQPDNLLTRRMNRLAAERASASMPPVEKDIPETGEAPVGAMAPLDTQTTGPTSPRRISRMAAAKRVSIQLEDDIPEAGEPAPRPDGEHGRGPPDAAPHRRTRSVAFVLAAPSATQPRPRRPEPLALAPAVAAAALWLEPVTGPARTVQPRGTIPTSPDVVRTANARRMSAWLPAPASPPARAGSPGGGSPLREEMSPAMLVPSVIPEEEAASSAEAEAQEREDREEEKETLPRMTNRFSRFEFLQGPARRYSTEQGVSGGLSARVSSLPRRHRLMSRAESPFSGGALREEISPATPVPPSIQKETSVEEEKLEKGKIRRKRSRLSRFAFPHGFARKHSVEQFSSWEPHQEVPTSNRGGPQMSRMRRFSTQIGRLFGG